MFITVIMKNDLNKLLHLPDFVKFDIAIVFCLSK